MSTLGVYHDECGGYHEYTGGVQYTGGYQDACGGYHEYTGGVFSTPEGHHEYTRDFGTNEKKP